ncbi:TauD/TfdA dioxygenase family protein [Ilumatobacter coccineus]|nr:TauD/TfdA family dioxygenase [Ilumatobacter coccineus]
MTITDMPTQIPTDSSDADRIEVVPQSRTIGAELHGIDLSRPLSDAAIALVRRALLDWKVLFFRDQDITTEQHLEFARRFGPLEIHPFAPEKPGFPEVLAITHDEESPGHENLWHSDVTWRLEPSLGSVLRMIDGPELGGDTVFSDMYAAYDGLPQRIKERVDGLVARHDFTNFRRRMIRNGATPEQVAEFDATYPNPEHPVVRTHPETGRKGIYVNAAFTQEIAGLDPDESAELLDVLYRQAAYPEYQVRFRWAPNSIAFWDNRSCQHYAVSDYWPDVRKVERVTIIGDAPYFDPAQAPTDLPERPFRGVLKRWTDS